MAQLTFDAQYGEDGSIGMTLAVTEGPMLDEGDTFQGQVTTASGRTYVVEGTAPERRGDFGLPEAEGWTTELVSEDHVSGTARYIARPG